MPCYPHSSIQYIYKSLSTCCYIQYLCIFKMPNSIKIICHTSSVPLGFLGIFYSNTNTTPTLPYAHTSLASTKSPATYIESTDAVSTSSWASVAQPNTAATSTGCERSDRFSTTATVSLFANDRAYTSTSALACSSTEPSRNVRLSRRSRVSARNVCQ